MKKGAVTLFIILGLMVLIILTLTFYVKTLRNDPSIDIISADVVESYVKTCFDKISVEGIYNNAATGGYSMLPPDYFNHSVQGQEITTSYAFTLGAKTLISKDDMETHLEAYILDKIGECVRPEIQGIAIVRGTPGVEVNIRENNVNLRFNYPINLTQGGALITLKNKIDESIPIRLGKIYDLADILIDDAVAHPDRGPNLNHLADISLENMHAYYAWTNDSLVYIIHDYDSSIKRGDLTLPPGLSNRQFSFNMALRYK